MPELTRDQKMEKIRTNVEVTEDQAAWYANWQQSDTYRQM
jgi:hypothetical protein